MTIKKHTTRNIKHFQLRVNDAFVFIRFEWIISSSKPVIISVHFKFELISLFILIYIYFKIHLFMHISISVSGVIIHFDFCLLWVSFIHSQ